MPTTLSQDEPAAAALIQAIRSGNTTALEQLLRDNPELARARIQDAKGTRRSSLHIVADWPGHFPNAPASVRLLVAAGADPNAQIEGSWHKETPLHWAASSDDVDLIDALLEAGADLEMAGASIAGGSALDDAVGYGQFNAARRLFKRGARTKLWHAAALGLLPRVVEICTGEPKPTPHEITEAFWQACHGGRRATAEFLVGRGAELNWIPPWSPSSPLDMAQTTNPGRPQADDLVDWLKSLGAKPASELASRAAC